MQEITNLRDIQLVGIDILERLAGFLQAKSLKYYLAWGTLLGAVRHQGFIPWDDDIDVMMPREDYEAFAAIALQKEIHPDLEVFVPAQTPEYYMPNIRVCDKRTEVRVENQAHMVNHGIWVTIFPLDTMPKAWITRTLFDLRTRFLCSVIYNLLSHRVEAGSTLRLFAKRVERFFYPPSSISRVAKRAERIFKKYQGVESQYLAILTTKTSKRKLFSKDWFANSVLLQFEGKAYPAPRGYSEVLTALYGHYLELPPEESRVPKHSYTAFWRYKGEGDDS